MNKVAFVSDESAKPYLDEHSYPEGDTLILVAYEIWTVTDNELDWQPNRFQLWRDSILVRMETLLADDVVTYGMGYEFNWLEIEHLEETYIPADSDRIPSLLFENLAEKMYEKYEDDENWVYEEVESAIGELGHSDQEKLSSGIHERVKGRYLEIVKKQQAFISKEKEIRALHPVFDPESFSIFKEELLTGVSLRAWASEFRMRVVVTHLSNAEALSGLILTLFRKGQHLMAPERELEQIKCVAENQSGTASAENILNELFKSGWIDKFASDAFKEHLSI